MGIIEDNISSMPGFKISGTHFKIGSKIHISDFYYAKRFFQNGFFASRVAFLLASEIIQKVEHLGLKDDISRHGLTLVGYEMYSELLLSLVEKFLRRRWKLDYTKLNHNLYEDFTDLRLCKHNNILKNVVIIVPIASTFSTSIKIEQQIYKDYNADDHSLPNIFKQHLNVLYISDGIPNHDGLTKLEETFNWKEKSIANREVVVDAFYSDHNTDRRSQKYFLTLPTQWYPVENCPLCDPGFLKQSKRIQTKSDIQKDILGAGDLSLITDVPKELPLYETDATSVTPSVVFDYPRGRIISDQELRRFELGPDMISYGHHARNNAHFLYAINTELFLERNKELVKEWLLGIRKGADFSSKYSETDRVIIVSLCHYSNVSFISLVNDVLFGSAANIIHYDPSNDFVQNFKIVYGRELKDANRIYFVDDSLKSGSVFEKINQFVQNSIDGIGKAITGCVFLLNKSQAYTTNGIKGKIIDSNQLFAFGNMHLYTSLKPFERSPLQIEQDRYASLIKNSLIDSLKAHFQRQHLKLSIDRTAIKKNKPDHKASRHLMMLIATHRIYQYFSSVEHPKTESFGAFIKDLFVKTKSPIFSASATEPSKEEFKAYLKVLTQSPFIQFKPLKDHVFDWVLDLLMENIKDVSSKIESIKKGGQSDQFSYADFDELKFYIRRAGLVNSNFLISKAFLEFVVELYQSDGIPALILSYKQKVEDFDHEIAEKKETYEKQKLASDLFEEKAFEKLQLDAELLRSELNKLSDFYIFFTAQVKELTLKNETRCLTLENTIKDVEKECLGKNDGINGYIAQIFRILREENALVIKTLYGQVSSVQGWSGLYRDGLAPRIGKEEEEDIIDYLNEPISRFMLQHNVKSHHKTQTVYRFLGIEDDYDGVERKMLLDFLWLKYFLGFDRAKKIALSLKTAVLMRKLMQLFIDSGTQSVGAFFMVADSKEKLFVAFNQNANGLKEFDDEKLSKKDGCFDRFLNAGDHDEWKKGERRIFKTVVEFERVDGKWQDLYATPVNDNDIDIPTENFVPEDCDRIILIRLNRLISLKGTEKPQGILGFYYKSQFNAEKTVNLQVIRYLLLLRGSLSRFIENHHESDEFRDWKIADIKQKTSLLTGHGREMLVTIALSQQAVYKDIIMTLLTVQRFMIDKREESKLSGIPNHIPSIFNMFYSKKRNYIKSVFVDEMEKMANEIFSFEEIENQDYLHYVGKKVQSDLNFRFDKSILRMIFFEIFVNAKKNRWLFLGEDLLIDPVDKRLSPWLIIENEGGAVIDSLFEMNRVWISANIDNGKMRIEISNTGPYVEDIVKVNRGKNIKKYDNISGLELISSFLSEFDLGSVSFTRERLQGEFGIFTVIIELNEMLNEDGE